MRTSVLRALTVVDKYTQEFLVIEGGQSLKVEDALQVVDDLQREWRFSRSDQRR